MVAAMALSKLPIFQSSEQFLNMQTQWAAALNPWLLNPMAKGIFLNDVTLKAGANSINHLLQRMQQGWAIVDIQNPITVYRSQPFNATTLTLTSSGAGTVSLYVF